MKALNGLPMLPCRCGDTKRCSVPIAQPQIALRAIVVLLLVVGGILGPMADGVFAAKPVAVVTTGRDGQSDAHRLIYSALLPRDITFEVYEDLPAPEEFSRFSALICSGVREPLADEQITALRQYVADGGTLVHTGTGLFYRGIERRCDDHPWLGAANWRYHRDHIGARNEQPDHPFFEGIDPATDIAWFTGYYSIEPNEHTTSLLGHEGRSLLAVTQWGEGRVVWAWEGLFRLGRVHEEEDLTDAVQLFANIIESCQPLKVEQQLAQRAPGFAEDPASLLVWQRDWQYEPQAGPRFQPAYADETERVSKIRFHSAMNERDTTFVLCQSLTPQVVNISLSPLRRQDDGQIFERQIELYVSAKPPVVPDLVPEEHPDWPQRLGRYHLRPITDQFNITDIHPRVLWLELDTHGLSPGQYTGTLELRAEQGAIRSLPIHVEVYPVRMPRKRLVELRMWGGGMPDRQPFLREKQQQGVAQVYISYPDLRRIRLRGTGQTLREALRKTPEVFRSETFPALDFTQAYDEELLAGLDHGLHYVRIADIRTGRWIAEAAAGVEQLPDSISDWPKAAQRAYTGYERELYRYLRERGFRDADMTIGDEPTWQSIQERYLPLARMIRAGGLGVGTTWTAGGFNTAERINQFAPFTTNWSMYTIMMPRFLDYVRSGQVELDPRASVGVLRGGWGLALRNAPNVSRTYCWNVIHYGKPVRFIMTGPIWKEWLYYVDTDADLRTKPEGISGARLLAYGDADRSPDVPLWSSSDWEATRDGVDDANLDRILTLTLDALEKQAPDDPTFQQNIRRIRAERADWFTTKNDPSRIQLRPATYDHGDLHYDYSKLQPPSTAALDQLKQRLLDHLASLADDAADLPASLRWNGWQLGRAGGSVARVMVSQSTTAGVGDAVMHLRDRATEISGLTLPAVAPAQPKRDRSAPTITIGLAEEPHVQATCERFGWQIDEVYPGPDNYLIKRDREAQILLIAATSLEALDRGIRHFSVFLEGRHHWLAADE